MKNNIAKIIILSGVVSILGLFLWFSFPPSRSLTRITVVGNSKAKLSPDTAVIRFSVITQNKKALEAQKENARKSEAVRKAVEAVTADSNTEIKTGNYILEPKRIYRSSRMPRIIGFEAKNSVTVVMANLENVGSVIDAATKAGANSIDGISFSVSDLSVSKHNALEAATNHAMSKVKAIAQTLNGKIVRIVETREATANDSFRRGQYYSDSDANTTAIDFKTPIRAGSIDAYSTVLLIVDVAI